MKIEINDELIDRIEFFFRGDDIDIGQRINDLIENCINELENDMEYKND